MWQYGRTPSYLHFLFLLYFASIFFPGRLAYAVGHSIANSIKWRGWVMSQCSPGCFVWIHLLNPMQAWVIFSTDTPTTAFVGWIRLCLFSTQTECSVHQAPGEFLIPCFTRSFICIKGIFFAGVPHHYQVGINCGAIHEASRSLKAIDKRVIIDFCDKNVVIARFCDKNEVFI